MSDQLLLFETTNPIRDRFKIKDLNLAPDGPGIYWMTDRAGELLYIGKAKSLRKRLKSYRNSRFDEQSSKIRRLLSKTDCIRWRSLETEADALEQEKISIRSYCPPCNTVGIPNRKMVWLSLARMGADQLSVRRHFESPSSFERSRSLVFGPYSRVASILLFQTSLCRRLWARANESANYPPPLLRNVAPVATTIVFPDEESREAGLISAVGLLSGLVGCAEAILPEEEPLPFAQLLWRNDQSRLNEFFRRAVALAARESVASESEAF